MVGGVGGGAGVGGGGGCGGGGWVCGGGVGAGGLGGGGWGVWHKAREKFSRRLWRRRKNHPFSRVFAKKVPEKRYFYGKCSKKC